jgi:hypothetical protein
VPFRAHRGVVASDFASQGQPTYTMATQPAANVIFALNKLEGRPMHSGLSARHCGPRWGMHSGVNLQTGCPKPIIITASLCWTSLTTVVV